MLGIAISRRSKESFGSECFMSCANVFVSAPTNFKERSCVKEICGSSAASSTAPRSLHCSMERCRKVSKESVVDNDVAEAKTSWNVTFFSCTGGDPVDSAMPFGRRNSPWRTRPCSEGRYLTMDPISVGLIAMAPEASQTPRDDPGDQESSRRMMHRATEGEL